MLHDDVLRLRARPDADPSRRREEGEMVAAIQKLVGMLSALSQRCPNRCTSSLFRTISRIGPDATV